MLSTIKELKKLKLLKTYITNASYNTIVSSIIELGRIREQGYVCVVNTHMLIEAYLDAHFQEVVNGAVLNTADGKPVAVALNLIYDAKQERVAGMDLMPDIIQEAEANGLSVFF